MSYVTNKKVVQSQGTTALCRHLYRRLAPNPWTTQWIERTLKLSINIGKLSKNDFTSVPVKDWWMSTWCHGTLDQISRNSWKKFPLA